MKSLHIHIALAFALCIPLNLAAQGHLATREFLMGRTHYETDSCFVPISREYTRLALEYSYIQKQTYAAYLQMRQAAQEDGITLNVTSASRNYWVQKFIWEKRWQSNGGFAGTERLRRCLQYISMPGTSRHHWGTDLDFCSKELAFWRSEKGKQTYLWLRKNAGRFGFFQPYTSKAGGRTGYEEERWHWSYAPLADIYTEAYRKMITPADLKGFAGASEASGIDIIGEYVLGIENVNFIPEVDEAPFKALPLLEENEKDGKHQTSEGCYVIPLDRLGLEHQCNYHGEDRQ